MAIDDIRLDRVHFLIADAEAGDGALFEVLDDGVGPGGELEEYLPPFVGFEIEGEGFFVAMGDGQPIRHAVPMTRHIARPGLDLDHLRAHIGELARAPGPRRADLDGENLVT